LPKSASGEALRLLFEFELTVIALSVVACRAMTSAAESISFNIVEGCGSDLQRDFARFLDIGIKSAMELENQLKLARDYGILHTRDWEPIHEATVDVRRMLYGLRKKVRAATIAFGTSSPGATELWLRVSLSLSIVNQTVPPQPAPTRSIASRASLR
jgi:four helix bundle protein